MNYHPANVISYLDYYPFGMLMPNRHGQNDSYRYGYQGSEKDDEVNGTSGTSYTTHFRQLDTRIGRWLSIDPKATAHESPYVSMANSPLWFNDVLGDTSHYFNQETGKLIQSFNYGEGQYRFEVDENFFKDRINDIEEGIDCKDISTVLTDDNIHIFNEYISGWESLLGTTETYVTEVCEPSWMSYSRGEMGTNEDDDCSTIIGYHNANRSGSQGGYRPTGCETGKNAWCASFVGWTMSQDGQPGQFDPSARAWSYTNTRNRKTSTYGTPTWGSSHSKPFLGAIGVRKSGSQWHVGFIVGQSEDGIWLYMVGGNQGDEVNITKFRKSSFKAYMSPVGYVPTPSAYTLPVMDGGTSGGSTR